MTDTPTEYPPFAAWLRHEDQHLREDPIGRLAAQIRGDRQDPSPANLPELMSYLISANAASEMIEAAVVAWAFYLAQDLPAFAADVAECAEIASLDHPGEEVTLTAAELVAELSPAAHAELCGDPPAEPEPERLAARVVCDLVPWLFYVMDTTARVDRGTITLGYDPDNPMLADPRYGGAEPGGRR